ncbi:MAG TPA: PA14 domain-containing protein [Anaerolineae bacterium]|nr:PA14 domain-containing protein [Anaerolineae bacterium]
MSETRPTDDLRMVTAIVALGSLLLMVVIGLGIGIVNQLSLQSASAAPAPASNRDLLIDEPAVSGGATFTLFGADWPPNTRVVVSVIDPALPSESLPLLSGETDAQGRLLLKVTYPTEPRWTALPAVDVLVQTEDQRVQEMLHVALNVATPVPVETALPTPAPPTPLPPTPLPTPTPTPQTFPDWMGEYFNNPALDGAPVLARNDAQVRFSWGIGSPDGSVPTDNFSARWTRTLNFPGGVHRFTVSADDGVRVSIDGTTVIDEWHAATGQTYSRDVNLGAGLHSVRVEMVEQTGLAAIDFSYEQPVAITEWQGEYFANRDLSGAPALVRNDPALNFSWGNGSPDQRIPLDGFSARWTRELTFPAGVTQFTVRADDGARLFVDNVRVIDEWHDGPAATYTGSASLNAGRHTVALEYYENTGSAAVTFNFQPTTFAAWKGEYFANRDLNGAPVLVRDDAELNFNWLDGAPAPELPTDDFSARWTRTLNFEPGAYSFTLSADDGVRLYLDDVRVRDEWHDGSTTYNFTVSVPGGSHTLRLEYYEHLEQARLSLSWQRLADTLTPSPTSVPPSPTPTAPLIPSNTPTPSPIPTASLAPASALFR